MGLVTVDVAGVSRVLGPAPWTNSQRYMVRGGSVCPIMPLAPVLREGNSFVSPFPE